MAEGNEMTEVFVGAQTAVGLFVISGIIAMAGGFKKGAYVNGIAAQRFYMWNP